MLKEGIKWRDKWTLKKYNSYEDYKNNNPYEVSDMGKNTLLNSGINELWDLVSGDSVNNFDNTNSRIGVGDDATAVDVENDTDLKSTANTEYLTMQAGYPSSGANEKIVFQSEARGDDANFDWKEFVLKQNTSGICLNRLVSDQGTKVQGQIWTTTIEVSLS